MQEDTQLPTTPPLSGADLVDKINAALQTLGTNFSGADDPASLAWAYATWADTGNMRLKRRNGANSAWVDLGPLLTEMAAKSDISGLLPGATFAEVDALTEDQGPIIVTDMAGDLYVWTESAYFTGYRNPRSGLWYGGANDTPEAWELLATGGVWSESDPKHARVIARYREWGRTVAAGAWTKGWNHIADLGGGDWKAADLSDVFQRMSGTDADTANPRLVGSWQRGSLNAFDPTSVAPSSFGLRPRTSADDGVPGAFGLDKLDNMDEYPEATVTDATATSLVATVSNVGVTRPENAAVAPVILV